MEETETEPLKGIFQDYTCRLCLMRNDENAPIFGPKTTENDFIEKLSRYLSIKVTLEDELPKWVCRFCRQSLESFHTFYSKVHQIQESLYSMLSIVKKTSCNITETPRLDEVTGDGLETNEGFVRHKKVQMPCKSHDQPVQTARRSNRKRKPKNFAGSQGASLLKANSDVDTSIEVGNSEDLLAMDAIRNSELPPDFVENGSLLAKTEDANSLEDQYWRGQGLSPEMNEKESKDDTWRPSHSKRSYRRSVKNKSGLAAKMNLRKRKPVLDITERADKDTTGIDEEKSELSDPETETKQQCNSTTPGTSFKPRISSSRRKMMRAEINAMMVQFYGITCDICVTKIGTNPVPTEPIKYQTFEALCTHMEEEHNSRGYIKCCNCTMREKKRAEIHMLLHIRPGSLYKCNVCGKQLRSHQSFKCHLLLHLPDSERPYLCNQCDRGFVTKSDLVQHEHQHLPDDKRLSFTCDICGNRFSQEVGLMMHKQRVHDNLRPHLCDICAKSFSSRSDMERHKAQIHGNVKREQCHECGKWFKGKSILKSHMRQHRGVSFECHFCGKKYAVRSSLKAHLLKHSDEKPHKCSVCEKSFKLLGTLKMHLNQHSGELPYSCPFCPKKFASSGNYYTHRKRMHPEEVAMLKEAQEAALAVNGIPTTSSAESIMKKITTSKAIVSEKVESKTATAANLSFDPSQSFGINKLSNIIPHGNSLSVSRVITSDAIPCSASSFAGGHVGVNSSSISVAPVRLAISHGNGSYIMTSVGGMQSSSSISTIPVAIGSVVPNIAPKFISHISAPVKGLGTELCLPGSLRVVNPGVHLIQSVTKLPTLYSKVAIREVMHADDNFSVEPVISSVSEIHQSVPSDVENFDIETNDVSEALNEGQDVAM